MLERLAHDVRYALRSLARQRAFTAAALLTLALGVGANTTVFSVVHSVLLRPLPVERPDELVAVFTSDFSGPTFGASSFADFQDFRRNTGLLADLIAYRPVLPVTARGDAGTDRRRMTAVTGNYFAMLGVRPAAGRLLRDDDDRPGAERVVVLSYELWQREYGGLASTVGRTLTLNGNPFAIAGIAPRHFQGVRVESSPDVWIALAAAGINTTSRTSRGLMIMGRLAAGATVAQTQAALDATATALHEANAAAWADRTGARRRVTVLPELETRFRQPTGDVDRATLINASALMLAVVGVLLLVACANVANLLLARASTRHREIGVRLALGARRSAIVSQWLTESFVIALLGSGVGLTLSWWLLGALERVTSTMPLIAPIRVAIDGRVVALTAGLALVAGVLFGVAPALRASGVDVVDAFRAASGGLNRRWRSVRQALVVFQLASSLALLAVGGVFVQSLVAAARADLGFDTERVALLSIQLPPAQFGDRAPAILRRAIDEVRSAPGVTRVGLGRFVPLTQGGRVNLVIDGYTPSTGEDMGIAFNTVGADYFETLGIPIVRGRAFSAADTDAPTPGTVVVSETFAGRYWPGLDPIGRVVRVGGDDRPPATVVGVAGDARFGSIDQVPVPYVYVPYIPLLFGGTPATLHVATAGNPAAVIPEIRRRITAVDPNIPVFDVTTIAAVVASELAPTRLGGRLLGLLSGIGLVLAVVGLYGVTAYAVAQRTREIGIRVALGATRATVVRLVAREGVVLVGAGLAIGLGLAVLATRAVGALVYGATDAPVAVLGVSVGVLVLTTAVAMAITSGRALRIEPTQALRAE